MFEELTKSIELEKGLIIPKIKGHTKIELTDVKTGKKEVVEHDNTFQPAVIAAYMRSLGEFNANPYNNSTWRNIDMLRNFVGGIFCFQNTITEGKHYMPAGNKMTANGAYDITNAGTPTELGTYNPLESVFTNNSATFVYDWGTAQGNGEISCVCLTSETGGFIGYGNPSGGKHSSPIYIDRNQESNNLGDYILGDNIGYTFTINNTAKTLTVKKTRLAITKASVFDKKEIETITLSYENALTGTNILYSYLGDGKIALYPYLNISNNSTYYFLIFDIANETLTQKKIVNTTGNTLYLTFFWMLEIGSNFGIIGNNAYIFGTNDQRDSNSTTLYVFNITSGALESIKTVTQPRAMQANRDYYNMPTMGAFTEDLYYYGGTDAHVVIYDPVNDTTYITNGYCNERKGTSASASGLSYNLWYYDDENDLFLTIGGNQYSSMPSFTRLRCFKNPLFLATINNLDSPVTKTSAKTMKISYTITLAE